MTQYSLIIKCADCGKPIGEGHTYGYAFYCEVCIELAKFASVSQVSDRGH